MRALRDCGKLRGMEDEIKELHDRADGLGPDEHDEAVSIYEAILRLSEGEVLATRGLALALIKLRRFDRADEVVQEALILHPGDEFLSKRAADIARDRKWTIKGLPVTKGTRKSTGSRVGRTWIKAVYYDGTGWTEQPGEETWLADPGQRDRDGVRQYTTTGQPKGRPTWRVGEQAGVYFGGTQRVPVLLEVIALPDFDPAFVQTADWAKGDDSERWPWVTRFRVLKTVDVESAPTLADLGISTTSMQQKARLRTDPEIHGRLVQALDAAS